MSISVDNKGEPLASTVAAYLDNVKPVNVYVAGGASGRGNHSARREVIINLHAGRACTRKSQ
jgi:hypothetical protein